MSYAERVHAEYRRFLRAMTPDQKATLEALPDFEGRLFFKRYLTGAGEERYRLATKPVKGRPSHPYRLARYSSFANLWYHLARLGALEFVQEEPATGRIERIDALHPARIQNEQGVGVGGWGAVDAASRPKRRYYRLTPQGEAMALNIWLRPKDYLRTRDRTEVIRAVGDKARIGIAGVIPELPAPLVVVLTAEELRQRLDDRLAAMTRVVAGANAGMEAGLSAGTVLSRIVRELGGIRDSLARFSATELGPARRLGVEVRDVVDEMERQDAILRSLTSVLELEGLTGIVDRIAIFSPAEFREALRELPYREVAGNPLLAAIFSVPVPAAVRRVPALQVEQALRDRTIEAQAAFRMMLAATAARNFDEARRQRAIIYTIARRGTEEGILGLLGLPVRTEAQFERQALRLFFLTKLHRVGTLVGLWAGLETTMIQERRSPTPEETQVLLTWEREIVNLLG